MWGDRRTSRAVRIAVGDPVFADGSFDYTDAFVAARPGWAPESPLVWLGSGLSHVPKPVEVVASILGMAGDSTPGDGLAGWRIRESTEDLIHLEYELPLMDVTVVGRNLQPDRQMVITGLRFRRKILARVAWAVIGPGHRLMTRRLVSGRLAPRNSRRKPTSPVGPA